MLLTSSIKHHCCPASLRLCWLQLEEELEHTRQVAASYQAELAALAPQVEQMGLLEAEVEVRGGLRCGERMRPLPDVRLCASHIASHWVVCTAVGGILS